MTERQSPKFTKFGQAFVNYGSYHYDTVNKIIHIICVPLIAATLFSLLSYIPFYYTVNNLPVIESYQFGVAQLFWCVLTFYYIYLSPAFGVLSGLTMIGLSILWKSHFKDYSSEDRYYAFFIINVVGWLFQFIGHGVFEKRKPALLDNLGQILNAPMFIVIQLCDMIGLRTNQHKLWQQQIKKNVEQFRNKDKQNKSS